MLIMAIDPGVAHTGYAFLKEGVPILIGHISTKPGDLAQRVDYVATELMHAASSLLAQPGFHGELIVAYEEFFGNARNLEANYQRGFLDAVVAMYLQEYVARDSEDRLLWYTLHPQMHLKWFHPQGKATKLHKGKGNAAAREETKHHLSVLGKRKIDVGNICSAYHPIDHSTDIKWLEAIVHPADALSLGLMIWDAIRGVDCPITVQLRGEYPSLTDILK